MTPEELQIQHERDRQNLVNAYHRVFKSEDGKLILADLIRAFQPDKPAFLPQEGRPMDPFHAAIRDGQRQPLTHINFALSQDYRDDSSITKPGVEVITGTRKPRKK